MSKLFDPHRHKLSDGEKEHIWRRITEPENLRARRGTQLWRRLGYTGSVVLAALLVGILWKPDTHQIELEGVPVPSELAPQTRNVIEKKETGNFVDEVPTELYASDVESDGAHDVMEDTDFSEVETAAAPVEPAMENTVKPSAPAHREAADARADGSAGEPTLGEIRVDPAPVEEIGRSQRMLIGEGERFAVALGTITGVVINRETGDPLPFANIIVVGTNYGAMSLEDGSFKLRLPVGTYTLKCLYMGYEQELAEGIEVWEGYADSLQFAMAPAEALTVDTIVVEGAEAIVDGKDSSTRKSIGSDKSRVYSSDKEEPKAQDTGVRMQGIEPHIRGGRNGEALIMIDGLPEREYRDSRYPPRRRPRCWVPPYYHNPNGEPFDAMYFEHYGTNPFVMTEEDALSTFALDVDEASYTLARSYLERGELPPADAIRVEEFVNYFEQDYMDCDDENLCIRIDGAPSPFGEGYHLLRVGVQAKTISRSERLPANLIFVIDTSGSMNRENRLELVKRALGILLDELEDSDTVGIVEYGSHARVVLEPTAVEDRHRIERALQRMNAGGSTNVEAGLWLGYEMAARQDYGDTNTRIILCSDGVANTGETQAEKILERVRLESDRGIALSTIGFGMGNYNDVLMEKLADKGDGNYHYVDELDEAARVFRENLTGMLQTVARDAKVQVAFDPESVLRWRLIGYENRDIADEDFRDDSVDAGELGSGHQSTALYEVKLSDQVLEVLERRRDKKALPLGEVFLRYEHPMRSKRAGLVEELNLPIDLRDLGASFDRADPGLRRAALAAEFAEILRESYWARGSEFEDLIPLAKSLLHESRHDEQTGELHDLIQRAARVSGDR